MLERFFASGYVVVPGAASERQCNDALRVVHKSLESSDGGPRDKRVFSDAPVTNLFNGNEAVREAVAQLMGTTAGKLPFVLGAQVALRFPGTLCDSLNEPVPFWNTMWHIDGLPSPDNGIPEGCIRNFTLLVGVCLRDVLGDMQGSLVVYPRSHQVLQDYFRQHGFAEAQRGLTRLPALPLAEPVQVRLRKGDAVLAHYSLAHSIAPNAGHEIRTMVYFRINARTDGFHPAPMLDIWADFDPRFSLMAASAAASSGNDNNAAAPASRAPGYVDATVLLHSRRRDEATAKMLAKSEALFERQRWSEAAPLFAQLADERPRDALLQLKAGLCLTAGDKKRLLEGEAVLRVLAFDLAPTYANATVVLARNLQRQADELGHSGKRQEAAECAVRGLLHLSTAADVAVEAVKILADLNYSQLADAAEQGAARYPTLTAEIREAARHDSARPLWAEGKKWLASEPKSLPEGRRLFGELVAVAPRDYWARILYGGCSLWSGNTDDAILHIQLARDLDPNAPGGYFPHSFALLAQALLAAGRPEEAAAQVEQMLDVPIVIGEAEHSDKIVEAVQVCADALLPQQQVRFDRIRAAAVALFPALSDRLAAVAKQNSGCVVA